LILLALSVSIGQKNRRKIYARIYAAEDKRRKLKEAVIEEYL